MHKQNFRYRGPLESQKLDKVTHSLISKINTLVTKAQELIDDSKTKRLDIFNKVQRRTSE